ARKNLPDDVVYRFCRAIHLGKTRLAERLPQASDTTMENTAAALPRRELLHPGAQRYLEEQGALP
ncbi:MAG: immunogenic protein precursor, partial [Proteobacteria bacterium]|nr:immunogenic protein precursor [Pseudomonadota bacterium]